MSDISKMQEHLLNELVGGRIDQATYQRRLSEIQSRRVVTETPGAPLLRRPTAPPRKKQAGKVVTPEPQMAGIQSGSVLASRYKIREQLGKGGMGEVWRAYDHEGDVEVVIKILPRELQGNAEEMLRVQQTFRRVHGLQHQHICPTHHLGTDESVGRFLVMKYIDGVTLRYYWKLVVQQSGKFPLAAVKAILTPVADALDYAHRLRVVHRDIKSENIMVQRDGRDPQIVDFGLAAEIRNSQARISQVRMEKSGTYPYMSPEQWRGQDQDGRTDQYALGVIAHELLTGRLPFTDRDPKVIRQRALNEAIAPVPGLSIPVFQVLCQSMAKTADQRFDSCSQFVKSLNSAMAQQTSAIRPPPLSESGSQPALSTAQAIDTAVPGSHRELRPPPLSTLPDSSESGVILVSSVLPDSVTSNPELPVVGPHGQPVIKLRPAAISRGIGNAIRKLSAGVPRFVYVGGIICLALAGLLFLVFYFVGSGSGYDFNH
ncbi:MAG: serine/threonine-protein kinase [Planctomycetota bacterium]|nr:serine/threonine-protein kinase [Planctomycetota bacterium]MDA1165608.1 serine/threonine-protein kinase [Planctomycetota bacterium]